MTRLFNPGRWGYITLILLTLLLANLPISLAAPPKPVTSPKPDALSTGIGTWLWQNPLKQGNNLFDVSCPNVSLCLTVGEAGTILKTTDSGQNWSPSYPNTPNNLHGIKCPDPTTCYVVGEAGTILKSVNGGDTWQTQTVTTNTLYLKSISCTDLNTCFAAGGVAPGNMVTGVILKTSDGGTTWVQTVVNNTKTFNRISCGDATHCVAVGFQRTIALTANAGQNWTLNQQEIAGLGSGDFLSGVACIAGTCYITGGSASVPPYNVMLKSTDNGNNWTGQTTTGAASGILDLSCTDINTCYSVGNSVIRKTTDGGTTWTIQPTDSSQRFTKINCPDANDCYVVGAVGRVSGTKDGGQNWINQINGSLTDLNTVSCPSLLNCYAIGDNGKVMLTIDGGNNWQLRDLPTGQDITYNSLVCPNPNTCYAVGQPGAIIKTIDNGQNWTIEAAPDLTDTSYFGISCPDINTCYAVGERNSTYKNFIVKTTNGGTSWLTQSDSVFSVLHSISCASSNVCYAVGEDGTIAKTENGADWQVLVTTPTQTLTNVSCPIIAACYAVGNEGIILQIGTTGASIQNSGTVQDLHAVSCRNATLCYAAGENGTLLKTVNSGQTWTVEASGTSVALYGLTCVARFTCMSVGLNGAILDNAQVVSVNTDNATDVGTPGTLTYALANTRVGQTIVIAVNQLDLNGTGTLDLPKGVHLMGGTCSNPVTINGHNQRGGLILNGNNKVESLKLVDLVGPSLKTNGTGNIVQCVTIQH